MDLDTAHRRDLNHIDKGLVQWPPTTTPPTPAINPQDPNATFAGAIINGIGQPGSTVSLDINGKTSIATDPVAADGTWKFVASLDSGATTITANDTNAAGLEGTSDALSLNVSNTKAAPLVAFEPSATMQNATTVDLSGFALPANTALKEVDISSDGKLIGKADLKTATDLLSPNWTFSFDKGAGDFADITATAVDLAGHSTEVTCPFELITGITGQPYKSEQITQSQDGTIQNAAFFGSNGSLLYQSTSTFDAKGNADAIITGAGNGITYNINKSDPHDEITNFAAKGGGHDTLNVAGSSLHNMSSLLSHSSFADGDLTIHLTSHTSITLDGVSKADLKSHASDIKFA